MYCVVPFYHRGASLSQDTALNKGHSRIVLSSTKESRHVGPVLRIFFSLPCPPLILQGPSYNVQLSQVRGEGALTRLKWF